MSVIIDLNKQEKQLFINYVKKAKKIGDGAESICYQIDDYVYKVLNNHFYTTYDEDGIYNDEIDLKSFLFPEEIYVSNNKIFATKTKFIQNEIHKNRIYAGILPDIDKIKDALPAFIKDFYLLSKNNILTIDIAWRNLIFDGESLYAIDTLRYTRNEKHYKIDAYKWNIVYIQKAMLEFITVYEEVCKKKNIPLSEEKLKTLHELPFYIKKVAKEIKSKDKTMQKIKDH